jgi:hypothetical protein
MESCPMTVELDGRQYLIVSAQDLLFAFTLPENLTHQSAK